MKPRPDIAERLRQGMTNRAIAAELGACHTTVAAHRRALGIGPAPTPPPPNRSPLTLEETWRSHTRPVDGGHLEWTGRLTKGSGTPVFTYRSRTYTARPFAFRARTGREPEGYVKVECDYDGVCVAPEHVDDEVTRTRDRAALAALTGRTQNLDACRRGHDYAAHRRYLPDGRSYCGACPREKATA